MWTHIKQILDYVLTRGRINRDVLGAGRGAEVDSGALGVETGVLLLDGSLEEGGTESLAMT